VPDHFLARHLPLTMQSLRHLILIWDAKRYENEATQRAPGIPPTRHDGMIASVDRERTFECNRHFLSSFVHRNQLSYCCVRVARRCPIHQDKVTTCRTELLTAYQNFPSRSILNADEICCLIVWQPRKTVVEMGEESVKSKSRGIQKPG
jgi:hypothetical protein